MQKLQWLREVADLSLDDVVEDPRLLSYSLRRLASRHAFACERGLSVTVQQLAREREEAWLRRAGASKEQWQTWEAGWLTSEQGRRWGWSPGRCPAAR